MEQEIKDKIIDIIGKAVKLGWVQTINGGSYMHVADVEKIIHALFSEDEMHRINEWVREAEKTGTDCKRPPEMVIPDHENLKKMLEAQAKILGMMMRREDCIYKICPFPNIPREV